MAYFCTKTGVRLIAPGTCDDVPLHDGTDAADAAEHAARAHVSKAQADRLIGTPIDRPAPDAALSAEAAKVAADVLTAPQPAKKPVEKKSEPKAADK